MLLDAPIDRQTKLNLDELLDANKDAFAEDERRVGTTPLIQMSIDTEDHPPIAKKPYTFPLKHYDWVKGEIEKLLEAGVIRESHSSWSPPIAITRTYVWPMSRVEYIFGKLGKTDSTLPLT